MEMIHTFVRGVESTHDGTTPKELLIPLYYASALDNGNKS